ncbi:MAG: GNAT family N-acetyltransferase [Caulobacter sp.]|nr:GNAT family N-acetyltransferase [Caulobacter sp.]
MSAPPISVLTATPEEAEAIRAAVRAPDLGYLGPHTRLAGPEHVTGLVALLSDPAVSGPIYDLPRPITPETIAAWVAEADRGRLAGDVLLTVSLDEAGEVAAYSRYSVWPDRSSAEIAGARRADQQNSGQGTAGAARSFGFMFEVLGVRLVGLTAALDNVRSARVIEAAGFVDMGERLSIAPDGATRRSRYWEMSREDWLTRRRPST